jgi:hypothetical protein
MGADFDVIRAMWRGIGVGEEPEEAFQISFNSWLRVGLQGGRVTSDAACSWCASRTSAWALANSSSAASPSRPSSDAARMSQHSASVNPPAIAGPLTAAITGCLDLTHLRTCTIICPAG